MVLNRCKHKTDYYVVQSTDSRVGDTLLWLDGWVVWAARCVYGTMTDVCLGTMDGLSLARRMQWWKKGGSNNECVSWIGDTYGRKMDELIWLDP